MTQDESPFLDFSLPAFFEYGSEMACLAVTGNLILPPAILAPDGSAAVITGKIKGKAIGAVLEKALRSVKPIFRCADISYLNLESAFGAQEADDILSVLEKSFITALSSNKRLSSSTEKHKIISAKGIGFAFLACAETDENLFMDIIKAKSDPAVDIVIVSLKWAEESNPAPSEAHQKQVLTLFQQGADVILGSHGRGLQRVEKMHIGGQDKLCIYSLGTVFSPFDTLETRTSAVAFLGFIKDKGGGAHICGAKFIPTYVYSNQGPEPEGYVFEPIPNEILGHPLEALKLAKQRLGSNNVTTLQRVLSKTHFEAEVKRADQVEKQRLSLLAAPIRPCSTNSGCWHGDQIPQWISTDSIGSDLPEVEMPRARIFQPSLNMIFGTLVFFPGICDLDKLKLALKATLNEYPHFASRILCKAGTIRILTGGGGNIQLHTLRSSLEFLEAQELATCAEFRRRFSGDFPTVQLGESICEINIILMNAGWVIASSVNHSAADALHYYEFLVSWGKALRQGEAKKTPVPPACLPKQFRLALPTPLRDKLVPGSWELWSGDGLRPNPDSEINMIFSGKDIRDQYKNYSLTTVMTLILARLLGKFALPGGKPSANSFGVTVAVITTLRMLHSQFRKIPGSPVGVVNLSFPSASSLVNATGESFESLMRFTQAETNGGFSRLAKLFSDTLEFANPNVSAGSSPNGPAVAGILNMFPFECDGINFNSNPSHFSRIRKSDVWELAVFTQPHDCILFQLGLPKYVLTNQVVTYLRALLPKTARELGCPQRGSFNTKSY